MKVAVPPAPPLPSLRILECGSDVYRRTSEEERGKRQRDDDGLSAIAADPPAPPPPPPTSRSASDRSDREERQEGEENVTDHTVTQEQVEDPEQDDIIFTPVLTQMPRGTGGVGEGARGRRQSRRLQQRVITVVDSDDEMVISD